jgi:dipeptidyl aminopeptidase/acylaminoacyl peptidase
VLLIHGETDETVPIDQSERMERAIRGAGRAVKFVRIAESDHYWASWAPADRLTMYKETETFLAEHLQAH